MKREHAIGLGLFIGVILAALGATELLRELWIRTITAPTATPGAITVFSAYLFQTAILAGLTFRAYRFDHHGIAAAAWILATWEAIAVITRQNLLALKHSDPTLYTLTAFIHILGAASLFLAMGARAHRLHLQTQRDARFRAQEYRRR